MARLEAQKAGYEQELAGFESVERTRGLTELVSAGRADLEKLMAKWEEVAQALEASR